MLNALIIGIDLSFNSTGITISNFDTNSKATKIEFYRLVFEKKPSPIKNINQQTYKFPINVCINDIIVEELNDTYSKEQAIITLKAMIACKRIMQIINNSIAINKPNELYFNIEGFIAPSILGINQFKSLSGLIMFQGLLRGELIKLHLLNNLPENKFKIFITSPSELKLFFSGNGSADKEMMLQAFLKYFDGAKLLPDTTSLRKVNDVIDSFALMINCFHKINTNKVRPDSKYVIQKNLKKAQKQAAKLANKNNKTEIKKIKKTKAINLDDIFMLSIPK